MKNDGHTLLFFSGLLPGGILPSLSIIIIRSLAFVAFVCSIVSCSSGQSLSPDFPAGNAAAMDSVPSGRDILSTRVDLGVRPQWGNTGEAARAGGDWYLIRRLDLFVFNDDEIGALDAYTRSYAYSPTSITVHSASGRKHLVAIANHAFPDDFVTQIYSYEDLRSTVVSYTGDHPSFPILSGETRFTAEAGGQCNLTLEPLMSSVEIRALRVRMDSGQALKDVRVYLTGVSNRAEVLRQEGFLPSETLNNGGLSETDLGLLPYSGMVYKYLGSSRTDGGSYGSAVLYCYPNEAQDESFASPYTRLVVEGTLDGRTVYYPIPINRGSAGEGQGIGRNRRYVFDLTITRAGTESPAEDVLPPP